MIAVGTLLRMPSTGEPWRVDAMIGEGGQGAVFRIVAYHDPRRQLALKWYFPHTATPQQRSGLARLVEHGAPGGMYLWPQELLADADGSFGYTMPLRPPRFRGISEILRGGFGARLSFRLEAALHLAHAYLQLHAEGMCYRDISFGNVFVDIETAGVLICDNDNVGIDGRSASAVLGTGRFMAPELVRRETMPSTSTDLHSLAVLIYYLVMFHHPLLGRRAAEFRGREGEPTLLGTDPLFSFSPADARNRPDPIAQPGPIARWEYCPPALQDLFVTSFVDGLADPSRRVRESVWRATLDRIIDDLLVCTVCDQEFLSDGGRQRACPFCRSKASQAVVLESDRSRIVLNEGSRLTAHHVLRNYDRTNMWGRVVFEPTRRVWGIENMHDKPWSIVTAAGTSHLVEPGRRAAISRGSEVRVAGHRFHIVVEE